MSEQTKDCEACFGTGNESKMRSPQPIRKILFHPCPACSGTGKAPKANIRKGQNARDLTPRFFE